MHTEQFFKTEMDSNPEFMFEYEWPEEVEERVEQLVPKIAKSYIAQRLAIRVYTVLLEKLIDKIASDKVSDLDKIRLACYCMQIRLLEEGLVYNNERDFYWTKKLCEKLNMYQRPDNSTQIEAFAKLTKSRAFLEEFFMDGHPDVEINTQEIKDKLLAKLSDMNDAIDSLERNSDETSSYLLQLFSINIC